MMGKLWYKSTASAVLYARFNGLEYTASMGMFRNRSAKSANCFSPVALIEVKLTLKNILVVAEAFAVAHKI